MKNLLYLAT